MSNRYSLSKGRKGQQAKNYSNLGHNLFNPHLFLLLIPYLITSKPVNVAIVPPYLATASQPQHFGTHRNASASIPVKCNLYTSVRDTHSLLTLLLHIKTLYVESIWP